MRSATGCSAARHRCMAPPPERPPRAWRAFSKAGKDSTPRRRSCLGPFSKMALRSRPGSSIGTAMVTS